ncbi:MAG: FAD-binding oxidoreductase [Candidatus Nanopelagicales bacterium]|nr:FAD-binding oxidoreductase [Candidatus Nanopelagicales bacterium]MDZ4248922.1 FAD-binding oxidoreductase [Candidatus Nanopelagicales bacterium]
MHTSQGPVEPLLVELRDALGSEHVLTGDDIPSAALIDWTGCFGGPAQAYIRPANTEQVAAVLRACLRHSWPVIPQGGNTGLVGGSVPGEADRIQPVILSTRRLTGIEVDSDQIVAGAGVTLAEVQHAAAKAGLYYGVDLAARDSATIGGTVATNAGGVRVCAYGMTRAQLLGVEAVLADGTVLTDLGGLVKNNTGYDLSALLCGSEGTLAVITRVRMRLWPPPGSSTLAVGLTPDLGSADESLRAVLRPGFRLLAAEVVDHAGWRLAGDLLGRAALAPESGYVIMLEVQDGGAGQGFDPDALSALDAVVAVDANDRARLWRLREGQTESWATLGPVHKFDVSLPVAAMDETLRAVRLALAERADILAVGVFGHLADRNLHLEVVSADPKADGLSETVLTLVAASGGSISAEHGLGRAKTKYLPLSRSAAEIQTMTKIKNALDPVGLLNPGVVIADPPRE